MDPVNGRLAVKAKHLVPFDVIYLLLPRLLKFLVNRSHRGVSGRYVGSGHLVENRMGIIRNLYEYNRHIRMGVSDYPEELLLPLINQRSLAVRHIVQHEKRRILYSRHQLSDLEVQAGVSAET